MRSLITSTLALLLTSALLAQAPLKGDRYVVELKPGAKAADVTALGV